MAKKKGAGPEGDMDELISISEAARLRDVSPQAIDDLLKRGKLPYRTVAGRRLLRKGDVIDYDRKRKKGGG